MSTTTSKSGTYSIKNSGTLFPSSSYYITNTSNFFSLPAPDTSNNISISVWFNGTGLSNYYTLYTVLNSTKTEIFSAGLCGSQSSSTGISFYYVKSGVYNKMFATVNNGFKTGGWHNLIVCIKTTPTNTNITGYLDGVVLNINSDTVTTESGSTTNYNIPGGTGTADLGTVIPKNLNFSLFSGGKYGFCLLGAPNSLYIKTSSFTMPPYGPFYNYGLEMDEVLITNYIIDSYTATLIFNLNYGTNYSNLFPKVGTTPNITFITPGLNNLTVKYHP
jgi:hypothetical protein